MLDSNWESDPNWRRKCDTLTDWISSSKTIILYVGAGVSTNANIPDYRGPEGIYTLAKQGIHPKNIEMNSVIPTKCHYIIKELLRKGTFSHVLSQNCDGLFLRSGIPQRVLSEIHGNMYIEVCRKCTKQYVRNYDTTSRSAVNEHVTDRKCTVCNEDLVDSIVHQGEQGDLVWPHNWKGAHRVLDKADLIIVLGTSCNVLQGYKHLWPRSDELEDTKVVLVNKTITVKDRFVSLKISADCDDVMSRVARKLQVDFSKYCSTCDPIFGKYPATERDFMMNFRICKCETPTSLTAEDMKSEQPGWWTFALKNIKVQARPASLNTRRKSARAAISAIKKNVDSMKRKPPKRKAPPKEKAKPVSNRQAKKLIKNEEESSEDDDEELEENPEDVESLSSDSPVISGAIKEKSSVDTKQETDISIKLENLEEKVLKKEDSSHVTIVSDTFVKEEEKTVQIKDEVLSDSPVHIKQEDVESPSELMDTSRSPLSSFEDTVGSTCRKRNRKGVPHKMHVDEQCKRSVIEKQTSVSIIKSYSGEEKNVNSSASVSISKPSIPQDSFKEENILNLHNDINEDTSDHNTEPNLNCEEEVAMSVELANPLMCVGDIPKIILSEVDKEEENIEKIGDTFSTEENKITVAESGEIAIPNEKITLL